MAADSSAAKHPAGGPLRAKTLALAALVIGVTASLAAAELGLRALGYRAWSDVTHLDVPLMFAPDPELGWRSQPGEYQFSDIPRIRTTIWPGGFRATAPTRNPRPKPIVLVGGSYTQGWAVTDGKTMGDLLQHSFPSTEVLNLGAGAYGTYQSLLVLQRFLADSNASPSLVIYGFAFFHEQRNVASHEWIKMLSRISRLGAIDVPYVSIGSDGHLERHPPVAYPDWPLKRDLASVALLQDGYAQLSTRERSSGAREATQLLIREMADVTQRSGAEFLVAFVASGSSQAKQSYRSYFEAETIRSVDCTSPEHGTPRYTAIGYDHPNALANADWAGCIEEAIRDSGPTRTN